ncbi:MAG: DMT family transporter [Pseudomonadota bacterium]
MAKPHRLAIPAALFVAVLAISFAASFFRKAMPTHPLIMAGLRLTVAAACLAPFTIRGLLRGTLRGRALRGGLLAGVLYGIHFGAWVTSLTLTSLAASVTLVTTTPLLLGIVGWLTGRDRPDRRLWVGLAVAASGLALIGGTDLARGLDNLTGDGAALLGMAAIAGYFLVGRSLGDRFDLLAFSGLACAVGAAALLCTALLAGIPLAPASGEAMLWISLSALLPQLIGHNLLTWALRHATPSQVAMAVVGEPVGATLIGWLWLGERVGGVEALGCGLTLVAVAVVVTGPGERR